MKINTRTLFLIIILLLVNNLNSIGQSLSDSRRNSFYTYIYKTDAEQTKELLKHYYANPKQEIFNNLLDSFPSDTLYSKTLQTGHYLFVSANENDLNIELKTINTFDINILENDRDLSILVFDKETGKTITNAKLKLKNAEIKYNPKTKTYVLAKTNKQGLLSVKYKNETAFFEIERDINNSKIKRISKSIIFSFPLKYISNPILHAYRRIRYRGYYRYNKINYKGYVAFNKPEYLPNDTVKLKILLTKKNGKFYKKPIRIYISKQYDEALNNKSIELNPISDGAYSYEFPLNDSLDLGSYNVSVYHKKKDKYFLENDFYIEDYQLNDIKYELRIGEEEYHKNEPINLFLSGKDINGLNVLDGKADIKVYPDYITEYIDDDVFIPNILWEKSIKLDALGETKITIPKDVLPNASMNVKVEVRFNNSNNETSIKTKKFKYLANNDWIEVELLDDTIYAKINNTSKSAKGTLNKEISNKSFTEEIEYPFKQKINQNIKAYSFSSGKIKTYYKLQSNESKFECFAYRQNDTIKIKFENPRKLDIKYAIYKNGNNILKEGTTTRLDTIIIDKSNNSYFAACSYVWGGENKHDEYQVHNYKDLLNVEINQADEIYPGQNIDIKVKVTDNEQKPIKNVNLTAVSVNGKFEDKNIPSVPYYGKYKKNKIFINNFNKKYTAYNKSLYISNYWKNKMKLDTISYYKFIYPKKATLLYDSTLEIENAQFSPFLFRNGRQVDIYLIYLDNKIVYYYDSDNNQTYSFIAKDGYHKIKLRTRNKEYILDSVLLKPGQKLDISINVDNLPNWVKAIEKPNKLTEDEISTIKSATLFLKNNFTGNKVYIWQNNNVISINSSNYAPLYKIIPIQCDSVNFAIQNQYKTQFLFEPEFEYTIEENTIKKETPRTEYINPQLPNYLSNKYIAQVKYPVEIQLEKKTKKDYLERIFEANPPTELKSNSELELNYTGDSSIFIIRLSNTDTSFTPRYYYGNTRVIHNLPVGRYQALLITNNNTYMLKDSIIIEPEGKKYVRFSDNELKVLETIIIEDLKIRNNDFLENSNGLMSSKTNSSIIRGIVKDKENNEVIPFANISVMKNGEVITGTMTDFDGNYTISLPAGIYNIRASFIGYSSLEYANINCKNRKISFLDFNLTPSTAVLCEVVCYSVPLISKDMSSVSVEYIQKMPGRSANSVAGVVSGVSARLDLLNIANIQTSEEIIEEENNTSKDNNQNNSIRDNFSDYGYWQANLITDENGEARFKAQFPDNITRWDGYVLAVGDKKSGIAYSKTKSYKKLLAQIASPRFLTEGDSTIAIGKIANYNSTEEKLKTIFTVNNKKIFSKNISVSNSHIDSLPIFANNTDSIKLIYKLEKANGYFDGEERKIPVLPIGVEETKGSFNVLSKDTVINFSFDDDKTVKIIAQNDVLSVLFDEIENLEEYPYYCMEQTSSKLTALLLKQQLQTKALQKAKTKKKINKLIKLLNSGQNDDGGWGWWQNTKTNTWMTAYVLQALNYAENYGYKPQNTKAAIDYLKWNLDILKGDELLFCLSVLAENGVVVAYPAYLKRFKQDSLSVYQNLMITRIKQLTLAKYNIDDVLKTAQKTYFGNYYWNDNNMFSFYSNTNNLSLLAYKIIETKDSLHPALEKIRNYFLEAKTDNKWVNTIDKSQIIKTLLPSYIKNNKTITQSAKLKISNIDKEITDFPFVKEFPKGTKNISIEYSGNSAVYFSTYQKSWNKNPNKKDSLFKVETWFEQDGEKTDTLISGKEAEIKVKISVKQKGKYFMIEVPIPAGCSYADNKMNELYIESHREYYKNKTNIYCEQLHKGEYIFTISLQPRFTGVYNLNPTKIEMMYFPVFYGRNMLKKSIIKN